MSEETSNERIARAAADLESIAEYAYSNGLHELGYTPHKTLLAEIERLERALANHGADLSASSADEREEYARVRSLDDKQIIEEAGQHREFLVRELANRYDVVCEKLERDPAQAKYDDGIGAGIPPDGAPSMPMPRLDAPRRFKTGDRVVHEHYGEVTIIESIPFSYVCSGALCLREIDLRPAPDDSAKADECGACDKSGAHCTNQYGICSRHGGRPHEASTTRISNPCICVERLALQANPDCPIHGMDLKQTDAPNDGKFAGVAGGPKAGA